MEPKEHQKKLIEFLKRDSEMPLPEFLKLDSEMLLPDELSYYQAPKVDISSWDRLREQILRGKHEMVSISASSPTGRSVLPKHVIFAERYRDNSIGVHDSVYFTPGFYDQALSRMKRPNASAPKVFPLDFSCVEERLYAQLPWVAMYDGTRSLHGHTGKRIHPGLTQMLDECLKVAEKRNGPLLNPIANVLQGMYGSNKPKSMHTEV